MSRSSRMWSFHMQNFCILVTREISIDELQYPKAYKAKLSYNSTKWSLLSIIIKAQQLEQVQYDRGRKKKNPANIPSVVRKIPQKSYEVIVACLVEHLLEADDLISSRRNVSLSVLLVMNELSVGVKRASVYEIWVRSRATTLPCPCLLWTDVFLTTARRLFITRVRVR